MEGRFTRTLNRVLVKLKVDDVPHIKRIIVTVVGGTVLIFGVVLIVTPGPAVLVIPVGLAILGTEYAWARRWLRDAKKMANKALSRTQRIIGVGNSAAAKATRNEKRRNAASREQAKRQEAAGSDIPAAERGDQPHDQAMAGAGRRTSQPSGR